MLIRTLVLAVLVMPRLALAQDGLFTVVLDLFQRRQRVSSAAWIRRAGKFGREVYENRPGEVPLQIVRPAVRVTERPANVQQHRPHAGVHPVLEFRNSHKGVHPPTLTPRMHGRG